MLVQQETALSWLGKVGETDAAELARVDQITKAAQQYATERTGLVLSMTPVADYFRCWTMGFELSGEVYGQRGGVGLNTDVVVRYWDMADQQMVLDNGEYVLDRTIGDSVFLSFGQELQIGLSTRYGNPIAVEYRTGPTIEGGQDAIILECLRGLMVGLDERSTEVILEDQFPHIDALLDSITPDGLI